MSRTTDSQVHTPTRLPDTTSVLIVGAGPVGLTLALELERNGVDTLLVERNATTTRHPKMDITNGRSMELFRRLGVADSLRKVAIPGDHPMRVIWATNAAGPRLACFEYPSVAEYSRLNRERNDGTSALEPPMRVSQVILEPALRDHLITQAQHVQVRYGWGLERFAEDADGVTVELVCTETGERRKVRARYLAGCDGAGSRTRKQLGIGMDEIDLRRLLVRELGLARTLRSTLRNFRATGQRPMDGRFYMVHFTTADRQIQKRFGMVWHLQSPEGWVLISQNDEDIWTLHAPLGIRTDPAKMDPREFVYQQLGYRFPIDVHVANAWTPRLTVADSFGGGRVWLAGDAVHQVTPTGGYGMNTGVADAVGLGWALAAQLQGWGGPCLLDAYAQERRAVALRNRAAAARHTLVRGAIMTCDWSGMYGQGWNGDHARRILGREISDLGNLENEALGIELGYRYDDSPVVCGETDLDAAPRGLKEYTPGMRPGARPPSVVLNDERQIFDLFGRGFTLLRFAERDVEGFIEAAATRRLPLDVVDIRDANARNLYQRDLVLVRPDQHVAWRGNHAPERPLDLIDRVRGAV